MAAMAMLVLSASPLLAGVVNCNSPNVDLQDAIDDAKAGATLDVTGPCDDGPYFIFGKNLNLRGFGGATLSAPAGGDIVLIIRGATVQLRDLTIDADDTGVGISIEGTSIEVDEVVVEDALGEGLRVDGSSFAIVTNSEFNNDNVGVVITGSSNAFLFRNTMQNNASVGIVVNLDSSATVQDNDIINNPGVGLLVTKMSSAILADNLIEFNGGPGILIANQYGYLSTESLPNTIQNNSPDVECQARGIFEAQVTNTSITGITNLFGCTVLGTIFLP